MCPVACGFTYYRAVDCYHCKARQSIQLDFAIAYPVYVATAIAFFIAGAYIVIVLIILGCIFGAIFGGKDAPQRSMSGRYESEDSVQPFIPEGETDEVTLEDGTTITKDLIGNSFHDKDLNEYRKMTMVKLLEKYSDIKS